MAGCGCSEPAAGEGTGVYDSDIASVLITREQIDEKIVELANKVSADYPDRGDRTDLVLIGVLKGAVMFMTDLARAMTVPVQLDFMAVSSYGSATRSSGVGRLLQDPDRDNARRPGLIVEDLIHSRVSPSLPAPNLPRP